MVNLFHYKTKIQELTFNKEERIGVFSVAKIFVEDFEWIFREQPINDFGVDAFVEITKKSHPINKDIVPSGRIIGLQIKSGERFFKEEKSRKISENLKNFEIFDIFQNYLTHF